MTPETAPDGAPWEALPPPLSDLHEAAARLRGVALETPLLESERLNARLGGRVLVKAEGLQHTGSFKLRGAWNYLAQLPRARAAGGLVALSSGNHGQAVAWAGRRLGLGPVVVLMPRDTPRAKVERTRFWGAGVEFYDRQTVDRAALLGHWTSQRGYHLVPAYDDRRVIAGAGTLALEAMAQAAGQGAVPDLLVVACSGGGLSAGCALALQGGKTRLLAVEPPGHDDLLRSLEAGRRLTNAGNVPSICDALLAITPGALPFGIHQQHGTRAAVVTDDQARAAVFTLFAEFGLVVEPGGALPLGALLADPALVRGRTVMVIASGRHLDGSLLAEIVTRSAPPPA
ncbi:threonine ammonia-lyase [Roseomonas sp. USHLN139]|uniref:threonine ammonia-lyase n=1 Tax=Roseomonas sp. USHLN139 TaxID=3081298 RepID=UPI003B021452